MKRCGGVEREEDTRCQGSGGSLSRLARSKSAMAAAPLLMPPWDGVEELLDTPAEEDGGSPNQRLRAYNLFIYYRGILLWKGGGIMSPPRLKLHASALSAESGEE